MRMSIKHVATMVSLVACAWLNTGCDDSEEMVAAGPAAAPAAPQELASPAVSPSPVAPPPGTPVAALPGGSAPYEPVPIANDGSLASYVTSRASAYFQDQDGDFDAKSAQEVVERAIAAYREIQTTKHDDSPDWPVFNDLSLLVKYQILRALPPAPEGQRFVYDAATRKVSVAAN